MERTFKTAFIGCGGRGREHAQAVKADPRYRVTALTDAKPEAAEAMKKDFFSDAAVYTDHREMLNKEKPEIVIVCLWTRLHLPVFRDCISAGAKAVLSEKPMAPTWGECTEMDALARTSGCQLTFSHQRRFAEGNLLVRKWIKEGLFGDIQRLDLTSPPNLLDCGTHTFDQAFSFLSETPVKWVLTAVDHRDPVNWFDVKAESMSVGRLFYENGVRASFQAGGPDLDIWGGIRVTGSKGFVEVFWDGSFGKGAVYADPAWSPPAIEACPADAMKAMVREALDCLVSGKESEVSSRKALRSAEVIFACYESVRRHGRVDLPLTGIADNPFITMLEKGAFEKN